ncbi:MAG: hypothetical protein AB8B69_05560 [Chitinophagales bacterium]
MPQIGDIAAQRLYVGRCHFNPKIVLPFIFCPIEIVPPIYLLPMPKQAAIQVMALFALEESEAVVVHPKAEKWIIDRTVSNDTKHFFHVPSTPIGWTAGKWSEWYPDVLQADGSLGVGEKTKYLWQKGW